MSVYGRYLSKNNKVFMRALNCSSCSQLFSCGSPEAECWCIHYPSISTVDPAKDCLCESCLKNTIITEITNYVATITPENALQNKAKDLQNTSGLIEDIDYYIENGLYVFTSWYHLKRGTCCKNSCRHCPY
jgi:hypothetical protein